MALSLLRLLAAVALCITACTDKMVWTEDVRLPDGQAVRLEREAEFEGPAGGPGTSRTESFQQIRFKNPETQAEVVWSNTLDEGRLGVVALWLHHGRPTMLTMPLYAGDEWKFGCPNPPFLVYQYVAGKWQDVPLEALPDMVLRGNVTFKPLLARQRIAERSNHLGVAETSASVFYLGGTRPVPFLVHLGPEVVQTKTESNCDHELDYLIKED